MVNPVLPLLTLVIKSIDADRFDGLNEDNKSLVNTLSMLCSFMSIDDFVSFIYSPKFVNLINTAITVKFEIGLYTQHEIILEMIVENNLITLTDSRNQNNRRKGLRVPLTHTMEKRPSRYTRYT